MINGTMLRIERGRLHLTQSELAEQVGVSLRTIQEWEKGQTVPLTRYSRIREVLQLADDQHGTAGLDAYSDIELLTEVIRRTAARSAQSVSSQSGHDTSQRVTRAGTSAMIQSDGAVGGTGVAFSDEDMVGSLEPRVQPDAGTESRRHRRSGS